MQESSKRRNRQFLNRLSLTTNENITAIDPFSIITDFFSTGPATEIKEIFMEACQASLSEKYSWKAASPGDLLYFYENMEKLVEACFLIYAKSKKWKKKSKNIKRLVRKHTAGNISLPCSLSAVEVSDPFHVIQAFFAFQPLKKWKQHLYAWMEAGLSNYTVLDSLAAKDLLPYHCYLQKLMDACWYIRLQLTEETN